MYFRRSARAEGSEAGCHKEWNPMEHTIPLSLTPLQSSGKPLFFKVANPTELALLPPASQGEGIRTWVRSLGGMQKEALVVSSRTGNSWRLASDEGA
jgi:hypothetical protein